MSRKKKQLLYPGSNTQPASPTPKRKSPSDDEPDVIQTAQGFAPNYEKFYALGMTTEEALVWCNID